jgi:hypothetical protein
VLVAVNLLLMPGVLAWGWSVFIVALPITILLCAGLVDGLGGPLPLLVVLVVAKTVADLALHQAERDKLSEWS